MEITEIEAKDAPPDAAQIVDVFANDLMGNIPVLRHPDNFNKFKSAIDDLKAKLTA